ncbi:MAG TPA: transglycosylase SLT domain-containing protein [Pyrinomonadaceae bacterium]|nr:transglycosylase SLT domain-containing protein [Pyrinomonadaceae bacterium]
MKIQKSVLLILAAMISVAMCSVCVFAQTDKTYQQMSRAERSAFVAAQARRIARDISGREYEFTPAFEEDIKQAVNNYTHRLGNTANRDVRVAFERVPAHAATVMTAFRTRNLSPLLGLYIPFIESEYVNIESPNKMGAIGMFQFLPKTGERYGLSTEELTDVAKSADAAAQYIAESINFFKNDQMKEALALLAYNRGEGKTKRDLKFLTKDQDQQCSICVLSADRSKLDATFRYENVFYVPRFFAAAIIGENPQAFGLKLQPLSSY